MIMHRFKVGDKVTPNMRSVDVKWNIGDAGKGQVGRVTDVDDSFGGRTYLVKFQHMRNLAGKGTFEFHDGELRHAKRK